MAALASAACMLLVFVPFSIINWEGIDVFAIHFAFFMMIPYGMGIITGVHEERRELEGDNHVKKGMHWIPALIIVFFITIAVVDSFIISSATGGLDSALAKILLPKAASKDVSQNISSQFTGAVSNDLQDEEVKFDLYVAKLKMQRVRGWSIDGGWDSSPQVNKESVFRLKAKDKAGTPITGAIITSEFRRASDMKFDKLYELKESEAGNYSVSVMLPLAGCWTMKIIAKKGDDEHEIKGETEIAAMIDGKLITPECVDGEPDVDEKLKR